MKPRGEDQAWAEEVPDTAVVQSDSAGGKGSPLASKQLLRERGAGLGRDFFCLQWLL